MSPASNTSGAPLPSVAILGSDALLAARPATPVQLALLAGAAFPVRLMGLVHLRNHIEHLRPIRVDETGEIRTWVENVRRVRSLRKYEFARRSDGRILVKGETDWVFVDAKTGMPRAIPKEVSSVFNLASE